MTEVACFGFIEGQGKANSPVLVSLQLTYLLPNASESQLVIISVAYPKPLPILSHVPSRASELHRYKGQEIQCIIFQRER